MDNTPLEDYDHLMDEFTVTEHGMRAVLETMRTMNQGVAELTRRVDAMSEGLVVLDARLTTVEAALAAVR